jgi:hypothetical protein
MVVSRVMSRIATTIRIALMLFFILSVCAVGLFIFLPIPIRKGVGPYTDYVVRDVSKHQQFVIPSRLISPVVIRYRIEGAVDDSATVTFQTKTSVYARTGVKGVVADSAVHDFYETNDMLITYQPQRVRKGHLVIKAALNW